MKFILAIFLLLGCRFDSNQRQLTLKEALKEAKEIVIVDSVLIDYFILNKTPLDTLTGKSFCQIMYDNLYKHESAKYFIAGKITSHHKFDILLFCREEMIDYGSDQNIPSEYMTGRKTQELFFFIVDKIGTYKQCYPAAGYSEFRRDNVILEAYKSYFWLFKDFTISNGYYVDPRYKDHINENGGKVMVVEEIIE